MSRKYKMQNPEGIYFVSFATINWMYLFVRQHYFEIIAEKKGQSMWNYYFRNDICSCDRFGTSYKLAPAWVSNPNVTVERALELLNEINTGERK